MTIEAELVEASDDKVTIRRKDGMLFKDVPLSRFSEADREYVEGWREKQKELESMPDLKADSRIRLYVLRGRDDDKNDYNDIDDRVITFEPGVAIQSEEKDTSYLGVRGSLVIVGKGVINDDIYTILDAQDFEINILSRQKASWKGTAFECRYDPDYGGFEYGGYLLVLRNRAGDIVQTKASKTSWSDHPERILNAKKFVGFNSHFTKTEKLHTTFGIPK
ncbi:MAG: hypothetical protein ACON39_02200 [Coraliomargaritaceae bacterium]